MATVKQPNKKQSTGPNTALQFIRGLSTRRSGTRKYHDDGGSGGILNRWLRELRTPKSEPEPMVVLVLQRDNPMYHSEGRGTRKRKANNKDNRRHSFNEQLRQRCVVNNGVDNSKSSSKCVATATNTASSARNVSLHHTMMSTRSTPTKNLKQSTVKQISSGGGERHQQVSPPPTPPVRDASSLKGIKYGPGHEKYPSWPEQQAFPPPHPQSSTNDGGSHRSKSWTDHTNYPKEILVQYTRPHIKRQHSYNKQLKTVMERCEKIPPELFHYEKMSTDRFYYPRVDRDGNRLGDIDYMVPSPPERDITDQLTKVDLEEYEPSYQELPSLDRESLEHKLFKHKQQHLTQADLEEYTRSYEEALLIHQHQKQGSYAQSEGYHSYVSSTDSTVTATPFLDRLRRDSDAIVRSVDQQPPPSSRARDSVVTTSSGSSSETLKWHGSMSDVSLSSATSSSHLHNSRQLIAHSARVQTPQRHHSESVLYIGQQQQQQHSSSSTSWKDKENRNNLNNQLKLFPVNTYTVQPTTSSSSSSHRSSMCSQSSLSVADRINELERQSTKYTYLDPDKKHRVSDPTLKAIQKKALLSYYERHTSKSSWRSEPQLAQSVVQAAPQLPPRPQTHTQIPSRRASCASDYASSSSTSNNNSVRLKNISQTTTMTAAEQKHSSNSCGSLSSDLLGPIIVGPAISLDDWVPERPPKNPHLRNVFPDLFQHSRVPSPDLPPPSPPTVLDDEVFENNEPLPPPPTDIETEKLEREYSVTSISTHYNNERRHSESTKLALLQSKRETRTTNHNNSKVYSSKRHNNNSNNHNNNICDVNKEQQQQQQEINASVSSQSQRHIITSSSSSSSSSRHSFIESTNSNHHQYKQSVIVAPAQKLVAGIAVSQKVHYEPHRHSEVLRAFKPVLLSNCEPSKSLQATPPPLYPRQARMNQSMRARIPVPVADGSARPTRKSSPLDGEHMMSQSKASSYLAARREREHGMVIGRYKRTMSPSGGGVGGGGGAGAVDKETTSNNNSPHRLIRANNNSNLVRRASLVELKCVIDDKNKSPLPDVLPVNAKVIKSESPCTTLVKNIESSSSPPAAPVENSEPKVIAGLQFIQRTEVTLRVNSCTIDVASQTEDNDYDDDHYATTMNTSSARRKLLDEIECERLSQDLASQLSSSDRLKCILVPDPEHKRPTDYVSDLFKIQVTSRLQPVHSTFRTHTPNSSPPLTPQVVNTTSQTEQTTIQTVELTLPSSVSTTYLTSSEPKTQFLTQYSRDMNQFSNNILKNTKDLHKKKEELVNRLDKKLAILKSEELVVSEECRVNDELGESVERHVSRVARPHEAAKFRLHVEEVGKITSLLLALSGRLATVENTLMGFSVDENEKKILENKRDKLHEQLEEAKKLKESIDKRSINVSNILYKYLNSEEYADYDHFINMKAKLIMDSREITDKIKLAEEQLSALKEALAFHQDYS